MNQLFSTARFFLKSSHSDSPAAMPQKGQPAQPPTMLTERGGRILKLLSGAVMLALGLTMLLRPQWLM